MVSYKLFVVTCAVLIGTGLSVRGYLGSRAAERALHSVEVPRQTASRGESLLPVFEMPAPKTAPVSRPVETEVQRVERKVRFTNHGVRYREAVAQEARREREAAEQESHAGRARVEPAKGAPTQATIGVFESPY